jgi:hypothetical protein
MNSPACLRSVDMCAISGPCGHNVPIEEAFIARDHYQCPVCGLEWRITQSPPEIYPSGFIMPGKRTIAIASQLALPIPQSEIRNPQ